MKFTPPCYLLFIKKTMNNINGYSSDCDDDLVCTKKARLNNDEQSANDEECDTVTNTMNDTDKNTINNNADAILTVTNKNITTKPCYIEDKCYRCIEFNSKKKICKMTYIVHNSSATHPYVSWDTCDDYVKIDWNEFSIKIPFPNIFSTNELKTITFACYNIRESTIEIEIKIKTKQIIKLLDPSNIKCATWAEIESGEMYDDDLPRDQCGKNIEFEIASLIRGFNTPCLFKYTDDETFNPIFPIDDVIYIKNTNFLACSATHNPNNKITFREQPVMNSFVGGFKLECKFSNFPKHNSVIMIKIKIVYGNLLFFLTCDNTTRIASVKLQQNIIDAKLIANGTYNKSNNSAVVFFVAK